MNITKSIRQLATGVLRLSTHMHCVILAVFAMTAGQSLYAHDFVVDDIYYGYETSTGTAYVTYANDNIYSALYSGDIIIPPTVTYNGRTLDVTAISDKAFFGCKNLTSVVIGDNVKSIGESAFNNCNLLNSVIIGNGVIVISSRCFYGCTNLSNVIIGNNVQSIEDEAFYKCKAITEISFPNSIRFLGKYAFRYCYGLKKVVLGNSINTIDENAFEQCTELTSISIPGSLKIISFETFRGCKKLASVVIGDGVTLIGDGAFGECTSLTDLIIPKSVTKIGNSAFSGCSSLKSIRISHSVTIIETSAFDSCDSLTNVVFEDGANDLKLESYDYNAATSFYLGRNCYYEHYSTVDIRASLLKTLTIGASVKNVIFPSSTVLETVYSKLISPGEVECSFNNKAYINAKLYVPRGTKSDYLEATGWKEFWFIEEMDVSDMPDGTEQSSQRVTVTADDKTMVYGDEVPEFTYTVSGGTLDGEPVISTVARSYSDVGTYPISMAMGTITNRWVFLVNGTLTITKAPLTVGVQNVTIYEGDAIPTFTLTYSGFKNNENESALSTKPTATTTATSNSPAGTYPITVSGGSATNYSFSYTSGTLTILKKEVVTVTADNKTMVYGDQVPNLTYTVSGGTLNGTPSVSTSGSRTSDVGTYPIILSKGTVTNQFVNFVNGTLTITKAPLTVGVQNVTIYEGDAIPSFTLTYSGFKNNQNESALTTKPTATTTATSSSTAGTYPITISGGSATNYSFNYTSGTLTILKKEVVNPVEGDINADGSVGIGDIVAVTNVMAGITTDAATISRADVNGDGSVGIGDIVAITNIMAGIEVYSDLALESTSPISIKSGQFTSVNIISGSGSYTAASSDTNVVTANISDWTSVITQEGGKCVNMKATGVGTATVTVSDAKSGQKVTISVTVTENVQLLKLSTYALNLKVGGSGLVVITSSSGGACLIATTDASVATFTVDNNTITVKALAAGTCEITVNDSQTGETARVEVTVTEPAPPAGVKAVDLGLPSGTLWANMNVGATSPQENGLYFAWGETTGYTSDTSDGRSFDWACYKWMTPGQSDWKYINKYQVADGSTDACWYQFNWDIVDYEFIGDSLTELLPEDDAAHANWGGDWFMPTEEDFQELLDYTIYEWITVGNVSGGKFTSKVNGNVIFLPAAGYRLDPDHNVTGSDGFYWSSTLHESYPFGAYGRDFDSGGMYTIYGYRKNGQSVRPVLPGKRTPENVEAIDLGLPSGTKWANMNIGATSPEDYGDYFAWGETEPKSTYNSNTYTHCDGSPDACHDLGSDIAGTEYDAATVQWGKSWYMPSNEQIKELIDNCTSEWTTQNGVNGRKFTSKINGNVIFFPATGYRQSSGFVDDASRGYCWSSSLYEFESAQAYLLEFYGGGVCRSFNWRIYGHSVRPVR